MAKKVNSNDKRINYQVERIRTPMSREKLNDLYKELKSEDDYVNYHLDLIEDTHNRYMITIMNDDSKSPIKNSDETRSYGFMRPSEALEFVTNYIDEGRTNSKPKAVMQNGYSKRSADKYKELVEYEREEGKVINSFTKPTFEDIIDNVYVNTYNGSTYHLPDEELPDDLREDVGVIIPGLIDTREEYFEFVKRLKDRGRNGLGRSIYERYEDYEEAVDIIDQYKQALYNKYGGKEEFFYAKDLGGVFGAYEYFPTVKPRFKKTARNIKMDRGINLNELALVTDMGKRIREELDEEIDQIEVNHEYTLYENTPPKFKDLPDDLKLFYKNDKNDINGFTHTKNFKSIEDYAQELIRSKDSDKQMEGYRILEGIRNDILANQPLYHSDFVDVIDSDDLSINALMSQYQYDKLLHETDYNVDYVDEMIGTVESEKAFRKFVEEQIIAEHGYDINNPMDKTRVKDMVDYASKYVFDTGFRRMEDEKSKVNSAGEVLYRNNKEIGFGKEADRTKVKSNESKLQAYVREIGNLAKDSLNRMNSNADVVSRQQGESTIDIHECTGYQTIDAVNGSFTLEPTPTALLKYMKNNEMLAKKIYEISSDRKVNNMFSERTNIDDFVNEAKTVSKPMITGNMIDKSLQSNRKGGR